MKDDAKQKAKGEARSPSKKEAKKEGKPTPRYLYYIAILIVIVVIAAVAFVGSSRLSNVSFSSFKQNFEAAPRVSIVVYYHNASIYGLETLCTTDLVEVIAAHRSPATIDFFTINNATCTYIPNGIGHPGNVLTNSSAMCLSTAASEPSISLNYSANNRTVITPYHLNIFGNSQYLRSCPIAVDIS